MNRDLSILVAGVGNIFFGDDAFGVEVVRRLRENTLLGKVEVRDFGIRSIDLAYALGRCDAAIVLDTVNRGGPPGTLYVLEPRAAVPNEGFEPHRLTPDHVLAWALAGGAPKRLRVVGCEPATFAPSEEGGLSEPVELAVKEAVGLVEALVRKWQEEAARHA